MKTLDQYRIDFEAALGNLDLERPPHTLYDPVKYVLGLGGKRLRPALVLAACDYCHGALPDALGPATGIELFHNFTLLHDDIMDHAPIRRGHPTVHIKWDNNRAILSGDTMFALAGKMMLQTKAEAVIPIQELFFHTAMEVCEGQQMDMDFEKKADVSTKEYLQMVGLKTAVLIAASLKTGALIAQAPPAIAESLYAFGYHCGIAFQLQDDFLDVYGDEASFGKTTGGDITSNKKTWLYLKSLELADSDQKAKLKGLYSETPADNSAKVEEVKNIFTQLEIPLHIQGLMQEYYNQSLLHLSKATELYGPAAELESFAGLVIDRKK